MRLPGWRSTLRISPLSRPLDLAGGYSAHGALSLILGQAHQEKIPNFCMIAGRDWLIRAVHWLHPEAWRLSDSRHRVELFYALRSVEIGPMQEVSVPEPDPGRYLVRMQTQTPLIIRQTRTRVSLLTLDAASLTGAVAQSMGKWIDRQARRRLEGTMCWHLGPQKLIRFDVKWNSDVKGGVMLDAQVRTDEHGLLALRVLAELGLGSYPSRGYGRIALTSVEKL